jgi:hypothetical protein
VHVGSVTGHATRWMMTSPGPPALPLPPAPPGAPPPPPKPPSPGRVGATGVAPLPKYGESMLAGVKTPVTSVSAARSDPAAIWSVACWRPTPDVVLPQWPLSLLALPRST